MRVRREEYRHTEKEIEGEEREIEIQRKGKWEIEGEEKKRGE